MLIRLENKDPKWILSIPLYLLGDVKTSLTFKQEASIVSLSFSCHSLPSHFRFLTLSFSALPLSSLFFSPHFSRPLILPNLSRSCSLFFLLSHSLATSLLSSLPLSFSLKFSLVFHPAPLLPSLPSTSSLSRPLSVLSLRVLLSA